MYVKFKNQIGNPIEGDKLPRFIYIRNINDIKNIRPGSFICFAKASEVYLKASYQDRDEYLERKINYERVPDTLNPSNTLIMKVVPPPTKLWMHNTKPRKHPQWNSIQPALIRSLKLYDGPLQYLEMDYFELDRRTFKDKKDLLKPMAHFKGIIILAGLGSLQFPTRVTDTKTGVFTTSVIYSDINRNNYKSK